MYQKVLVATAAAFSLSSPSLAETTLAPKPSDLNCQVFDESGKELVPDHVISGKLSPTSQSLSAESDLFYYSLELIDGDASLRLTDKRLDTSALLHASNLQINDSVSVAVVPAHAKEPSLTLKCTAL
jgi:hypothetical protein